MARPRKVKPANVVDELFEEHPVIDLPERPEASSLPPRRQLDRAARPRRLSARSPATSRRSGSAESSEDLRGPSDPAMVGRASPPEPLPVQEKTTRRNVPPPDPAEQAARQQLAVYLAELDATRQRLREGAERSLNAYLATQAPGSIEAKNQITALISGILGRLKLSIGHDGHPCSLYTQSGKNDPNGRFRLIPRGSRHYVALSANLKDFLPLKLIDDAPHLDLGEAAEKVPPGLWQARVPRPGGKVGRE